MIIKKDWLSKIFVMYAEIHLTVLQAYLGEISGLASDHCNKASIAIKQVVIFLGVEDLAFNLLKKKK